MKAEVKAIVRALVDEVGPAKAEEILRLVQEKILNSRENKKRIPAFTESIVVKKNRRRA